MVLNKMWKIQTEKQTSPVLQKQMAGAEKKHTRQVVLAYWWQICQYERNRAAVIKSISEWENVD